MNSLKERAKKLKIDLYALYLSYRDPRVRWYEKAFIALVIGYAISPIDLIPDFIPILGYLDDLILIPLGISLAIRMVPKNIFEENKQKAVTEKINIKTKWIIVITIICIWSLLIYLILKLIFHK
jgi:uncharacterized membrane protein YkvA (DUF1232 family)